MSSLYLIATPIGNLEDLTFRALKILMEVDLIICEDTRTTKRILSRYRVITPLISFYSASSRKSQKPPLKIQAILSELEHGKNIALLTDAGTPGISDPGNQIVQAALEKNISVVPIPGASSLTAIISVAGIDMSRFVFLGFSPHKKGRETFFKKIANLELPVIYFESPFRLIKNLELLKKINPDKKIILGRELTKVFEQIIRGSIDQVLSYFQTNKDRIKGEFVIVAY